MKGDIKERLEQWAVAEETHPEQQHHYKQLASGPVSGSHYVSHGATAAEQLDSASGTCSMGLLSSPVHQYPQHLELQAGMPVPVWQVIGDPGKAPQVLVYSLQPGAGGGRYPRSAVVGGALRWCARAARAGRCGLCVHRF